MAKTGGKQSKFEMIIAASDRFSGAFKGFNNRVGKMSAGVERMRGSLQNLNGATGLTRLSDSTKKLGYRMRGVVKEGNALVSTVSSLGGQLSLVFGGTGAGLLALAKGTANAGDAAAKAAARAGVGLRTWQEYAHAANMAGLGNDQLEKTFIQLQDMSVKGFKGDKNAAGLLKLAGINPKTAQGEIKNADSLFMELSDKIRGLQEVGKGAEATNLLKSMLGDEGTKLMPLLMKGSDGLKQMRLEAHKLGLVFSDEDAAASEEFNKGLKGLGATFRGIGFTLGRDLLPPVTQLIDKFSDWAAGNREIIGTKFSEWVNKLNIEDLWNSVESGLDTLSNFGGNINRVVQFLGGWDNVLIGLTALMGGKFIFSMGSMIGAFGKLGIAILTTPIGWLLGGIALIAGGAYLIYKNWDGFSGYFKGLWQEVKSAFEGNWVKGILTLLWNFNPVRLVAKGLSELINYFTGFDLAAAGSAFVGSLQDGILNKWNALVAKFKGKIQEFTNMLPDWLKDKLGIGDGGVDVVSERAFGGSSLASGLAQAEPLNMAQNMREISQKRTEHIEKSQYELFIKTDDGSRAEVRRMGGSGGNYNPNTGILASPA